MEKTSSGTAALEGLGPARTFLKPTLSRFPMNEFVAVPLRAREYPHRYHCTSTTDDEHMTAQTMERADFRRARPE